ncbi:MAG TPA: hypothetical protein VNP92_07155, partial [Actinophytocola sp.]|nr:hypothetical protein [Actinophytocola sp.]
MNNQITQLAAAAVGVGGGFARSKRFDEPLTCHKAGAGTAHRCPHWFPIWQPPGSQLAYRRNAMLELQRLTRRA